MKLQHLSIIFLIIILPILLVLTIYVNYHVDGINLKHSYDTKLLDATYDALKFYQLNTINNAISDISTSKIDELEAAVKTFYNSISTTFGYIGNKTSVMKDYIPAVAFSMYDGYYIYSPYRNVLTGVPREQADIDGDGNPDPYVDEAYADNTILEGLKSYIHYSCRYKSGNVDVVITYTLDNYITVQGTIAGNYVHEYGYLMDGIKEVVADTEYEYDGITFKKNSGTEVVSEYLGTNRYPYVKLNGTKYYIDGDIIFYINSLGERSVQARNNPSILNDTYDKYKNLIEHNNTAFRYYRDSYKFTKWVRENLGGLTSANALEDSDDDPDADADNPISFFAPYTIFGADPNPGDRITSGPDPNKYIQDSDSDFNAHRADVIRYTITKNLSTAIAGYNNYYDAEVPFVMPNISETDWDVIENNISIITFLQGFKVIDKEYNEYCVVANNTTKEYVSERDIYILGNNRTYYKINDTNMPALPTSLNYQPGIWSLNFEQKLCLDTDAHGNYTAAPYYPMSDAPGKPYIGSYSSIISSTSVYNAESDIYKYLRNGRDTDLDGVPETPIDINLKRAYYTGLGRERYGQYSVNHDIDISNMLD